MKHQFLVVGLGRFGSSVARTLERLGHEVLGLDLDARNVEDMKTELTHVAQGDATDPQLLRAIDIDQFEAAIVAIGNSFEASVLTTLALRQMAVPYVMAKAMSIEQVKVLELIGAHQVVFPEADAGELAAYQLVNRHLVDFLRLDDRTSVAAVEVGDWAGRSLRDLELRSGLCPLGVFRDGQVRPINGQEPLAPSDRVVLAGSIQALHSLARLT